MGGCDYEAKRFSVGVGGSEAYRENYEKVFGRRTPEPPAAPKDDLPPEPPKVDLLALLKSLEWVDGECHECWARTKQGHGSECTLSAAIKRLEWEAELAGIIRTTK